MKPVWQSPIRSSMSGANLLALILTMILRKLLSMAIGLKSSISLSHSFFGSSTTWDIFICSNLATPVWNSWRSLVRSALTSFQNSQKNNKGKPSGSGVLSTSRPQNAALISSPLNHFPTLVGLLSHLNLCPWVVLNYCSYRINF